MVVSVVGTGAEEELDHGVEIIGKINLGAEFRKQELGVCYCVSFGY